MIVKQLLIAACFNSFIFCSIGISQSSRIDSLLVLNQSEKSPAQKFKALLALAEEFRYANPDSCYLFAKQANQIADKQNDGGMRASAQLYFASFYINKNFPDSAIAVCKKNIDWLKEKNNNNSLLAQYYSATGLALMRMNRQKEALDNFYASLKIADRVDDKMMQFRSQNNIGWAFMELEQHKQAIEYFKNAIASVHKNNFPDKYAVPYNNLASCYGALGYFDSVSKFAGIAIKIAQQYHDPVNEANGWNILGTSYTKQKEYNKALDCYVKAKPIREKTGDAFYIVSDMAVMGELYAKLGRTKEGISICNDALHIAQKDIMESKYSMIYKSLAENYEKAGMNNEALGVYKKINELQDKIYSDANPKALAEMQTKYETEKKERVIEQQRFKLTKKNYWLSGIAGSLLLGGLLGYSYNRRNKLQQETRLQSAIIDQQSITTKAIIEAEEKERKRIAGDLHDGVGQIMSAAKMNLSAFESELTFTSAEQKNSFEKIISLVDESCREVRAVSHNMMPNALLKNSLSSAIREFIDKLDHKALTVHLYTEGLDEKIDANTETVLYRVIQECVNNVIKHAGADTLDISVIKDADGISATIEDNGKGFDTSDKEKFEGLGLKNIQTRVEYLKGTVDFDSTLQKGTLVAIHVPLH
jgi:two-component system, NarL family, sensor kinase